MGSSVLNICYVDKNSFMDFILLGILIFYFGKGFIRGFISTLFSLIGTFAIFVVAWKFCPYLGDVLQGVGGLNEFLTNTLSQTLNGMFSGTFSNMQELQTAIMQTKYGALFSVLLKLLSSNISFEGELTAGQILSPTLSTIIFNVVAFMTIFIGLMIVLKLLRFFLNKIVKLCGFSVGNKFLGGVLGLIKGLIVFSVFYLGIVAVANFTLNEGLLSFIKNGSVSNFLYENVIIKIINFFY